MIRNEGVLVKLIKGETKLLFDHFLNAKGGFFLVSIWYLFLIVETKKMTKTMSVEISNLHKILWHCGKTHLKAAANAYGIKVFGKLEACESYVISKAK
jgi:hypothetical protein